MKKLPKKLQERINLHRDTSYVWWVERFKHLMAENRVEDALSLADEFYEWLDGDLLYNESTYYSHYDELREEYEQLRSR